MSTRDSVLTSQNTNYFLSKAKSTIPLIVNCLDVLSLATSKGNHFAKIIFNESSRLFEAFSSRTNSRLTI